MVGACHRAMWELKRGFFQIVVYVISGEDFGVIVLDEWENGIEGMFSGEAGEVNLHGF